MKRFTVVALLLSAAFIVTLMGCGKAEPIKVAILAPLSGPVPTFGVSTRDGALLAIKEWNDKGGVLGKQIKAIVEDSQCTPDPALNAAKKVIDQDKVHYIIGEVCSKASIPVSEYANSKKVVQISPTSTNPTVTVDSTGKTKDYIFRACFTDELQGKIGAKFALQKGAKSAFLMLDQANDYVKGLSEFFEKDFVAGGGKIVGKESYTADDKDFSAILAKIKQAKADVVYLPDYYNIVNLATKQAKEKGITAPFMGGDGWDSSDLDAKAADGGFFTNHYSPTDQRAEVKNFLSAYATAYKGAVPDALATLAYDAVNMLLQAIKDTGADDATKVKDTLAKISFNAVSGKITFDKAHNPLKTVTIIAVKGGKTQFEAMVNP
jgi:branched-chain amino acid transport system substrate-binding protein